MSVEYDQYLAEHIGNVHKGLQWMNDNLPLSKEEKEAIWEAMIMHTHDASKYDKDEYDAYDAYFYGGNISHKVNQDFNNAWLRHIHKNPHHWQYWVLLEDDPETGMPEKPLMMPLDYIFEMIADWWTFSWRSNNLFEMFAWYAEHRDKQIMHPQTRAIVERILKKIWDVLIMQAALEGKDTMDIEQQYMKFWMGQEMLAQNIDEGAYISLSGIKGQRWGLRRFQNYDGSLTAAGRERYGKTVFVSGSSKTQTEGSPYYRKELPKEVRNELDKHIKNHDKILVGDAPGIDRQVQDYLNYKDYDDVEVYGPGKQVRYSANEKWKTNAIDDPDHEEGSKEWLAKKDKVMSDAADEGLAVILDEGAKATRNNVARMLEDEKDVKVFELSKNGSAHDSMHAINQLFKERRDILDRRLDDDFDQELVDMIGYEMLDSLGLYDEVDKWLGHSGIKGQKWGVRRYQNYDGSLTEAGKERYGRKLVESYEKLGKEYDKNHGLNLSNSAKYKKASIETTKLRHDILKSSKEAMSILNKAKKLDWDEDFDKINELRKDFKNAAEKTYKSVLEAYGDVDVKYMPSSDHKMLDVLVDKANYDDYFDLLWSDDLHHSDLDEEDKHKYGVPEQKKFPMPDKKHVKSAIRFFNYVDPKYEQELADAILKRAEEYGLVFGEDITVGDDNKFKKYLPKEES